jgi:hypothetical protein
MFPMGKFPMVAGQMSFLHIGSCPYLEFLPLRLPAQRENKEVGKLMSVSCRCFIRCVILVPFLAVRKTMVTFS